MGQFSLTVFRLHRLFLAYALLPGVVLAVASSKAIADSPTKIHCVDLVHMTHTDIGYTDHPAVTRELQKRFLDIAIDAVLAGGGKPPGAQFCWTAEVTLSLDDWWKTASAERRQDFLKAAATGRLGVAALAMNQTPLLNAAQWQAMLHWLPEDLWEQVRPQVGIQNDVNGFPRAGAAAMLDRGVGFLWTGINGANGGPPFRQPSAFWWKMPDGRRLFVWVGETYPTGFYYFHPNSWRRGPVPEASDTRYRPARPGDFFRADEASVRAAHAHLMGKLRKLETAGYDYPRLVLSLTNEWRMDNDAPFPALADFVETWNRLALEPQLRLTTAATALEDLEEQIGGRITEHKGEWTDWWANGSASGPREIAASRKAKRITAAALSPVWGPIKDSTRLAAEDIYRALCLFDEHTWGWADSVGLPHAIESWGEYNEKSRHAYHSLAMAKLLLGDRARSLIYRREPGFYVANTSPAPWSGWITMPSTCIRGPFHSLVDPETKERIPLEYRAGYAQWTRPDGPQQVTYENTAETFADNVPDREVRIWLSGLKENEIRRYAFSEEKAAEAVAQPTSEPEIVTDEQGWPVRASWPGMAHPLFDGEVAEITNIALEGFAARWDLHAIRRDPKRAAESMKLCLAEPVEETRVERNAHTTVYTQRLAHPRLLWGTRSIELFHGEPRARVAVRFHRTASEKPEWFLIGFALPCDGTIPTTSCGGMPFQPFADQLPNTCRDYYGIDAWVSYATQAGRYLWTSRDVPLVKFGQARLGWNVSETPKKTGHIYALAFDNTWFTNFAADSHGAFEFHFDLAWSPSDDEPAGNAAWAESLMSIPQAVIHPDLAPDPILMERLHRP